VVKILGNLEARKSWAFGGEEQGGDGERDRLGWAKTKAVNSLTGFPPKESSQTGQKEGWERCG